MDEFDLNVDQVEKKEIIKSKKKEIKYIYSLSSTSGDGISARITSEDKLELIPDEETTMSFHTKQKKLV